MYNIKRDIYFLTLPPAYHKEEGVFFKSHLDVIHIFFHYNGIKYCDIKGYKRNKKSQTFPGAISKVSAGYAVKCIKLLIGWNGATKSNRCRNILNRTHSNKIKIK